MVCAYAEADCPELAQVVGAVEAESRRAQADHPRFRRAASGVPEGEARQNSPRLEGSGEPDE
jgi:hypothetical protein